MDFTKLKIIGFKSFVERTELDIEKGLTAGFYAYLTKPINIENLVETINQALQKNL